ncbi:hypothetical protein [Ammoniphilus sp. CFH 90114]|uniref:hypothetical protein n=1 Tax=Ammoniphilus sp. CFH 90114 TaxID=2493665 RepID=UPI0013E925B6|nr:hypothetical protein [Ammoniphilus sp. CFH 90114]
MIFESQYRRKALESWESDKEETKKELKQIFEENRHLKYQPIKYLITIVTAMFVQN